MEDTTSASVVPWVGSREKWGLRTGIVVHKMVTRLEVVPFQDFGCPPHDRTWCLFFRFYCFVSTEARTGNAPDTGFECVVELYLKWNEVLSSRRIIK